MRGDAARPAEREELEEGAAAAQADYVIGAQDMLAINVWKEEELSLNGVEVRLDGKISVPLIDDIQAAGLTPTQLKDAITEKLKDYVTAPQVTVIVTRVGSKNVYMLGEVTREGAIPLQPEMRVLDALAISGGFSPFAGKTASRSSAVTARRRRSSCSTTTRSSTARTWRRTSCCCPEIRSLFPKNVLSGASLAARRSSV